MSAKQEWANLAARLRAEDRTWVEIAGVLRRRFDLGALPAMRHAHGWSQGQAARHWTALFPDRPKTDKDISAWETGRHTPPLEVFEGLAHLYQCDLVDLLADRRGYRQLDVAASRPPSPWRDRSGLPASGDQSGEPAWAISHGTVADLEALVASYRRAYAGKARAAELLPTATGLMHVLTDLGRQGQWPADQGRLASVVGQTAVLAGLLQLMGDRDLDAARSLYNVALRAAYEAEDWDLASYVLGSLAFEAVSAQRPADARALRDAAWDLASQRANPRTRAWVAALGSEIYARDGDETASRRSLDQAFTAMAQTRDAPFWKGVGWFDEARLDAYEGGNLVLLGRYDAAAPRLRESLDRLDPARLKHRCTLSADLALALVHLGDIDEACARASEALRLATVISHRESVDRVRRVHTHLLRWMDNPAVRELTEQLEAA